MGGSHDPEAAMFTLLRCGKECILENAIYVDIVYAATPRLNTNGRGDTVKIVDHVLWIA